MPKGEVLQDEALSGSQESGQPAEEVPKQHDHVEKCTGSLQNGRPAKLLNVHTHGVLARDNNCWLCTESDLAFDWVVSIGCSGFVIFHVPVDFFSSIQKLLGKPGGDL